MKTVSITKYPIVLVHGMVVRDGPNSWGRIAGKLHDAGFTVYKSGQDANGNVTDNAAFVKETVLKVLAETGAEKVNLIGHSKGGLDSRYMITHLGMADKVATLTTLATPHHGSRTMDVLFKCFTPIMWLLSVLTDAVYKLAGDENPKTYEVLKFFTTAEANAFNNAVPDDERVHYRSYGFYLKHWYSEPFMIIPHLFVRMIEGKNDGLLSPKTMEWGDFKGIYTGNGHFGISHCHEVDLWRTPLTQKNGEQLSDVTDLYLRIAEELAEMGY